MDNYGRSVPGAVIGGASHHDYARQREMEKASAATMAPVPNRASEAMFHEIGQRFAHLGELISRLEMLTDRACGCVPCDPKANGVREVPNTLTDKIGITIPMLDEVNSRILGAVQRLESFV